MATFEIGKKYFTTSACDHNCVFVVEIVKRTAKTVTFRRDGQERRAKIYTDHNGEYIVPERYSMAPVFRASCEYAEDQEEVEEAAPADPLSASIPQDAQPSAHPGLVMVGQPVIGNFGAMYPQEVGVIVGFLEREATRWPPRRHHGGDPMVGWPHLSGGPGGHSPRRVAVPLRQPLGRVLCPITNPRHLHGAGGPLYSVLSLPQLVICSRASRSLSKPNMAA